MVSNSIGLVLVSAFTAFIIGFMMHGPLFGKLWMRLANIQPKGNEKFADMIPQMLWNLVANIATAYALATIYRYASTSLYFLGGGVMTGFTCALLAWAGFIVAGSSMEVIWMGRSFKLWLFECFSSLLALAAMGAIIGYWLA